MYRKSRNKGMSFVEAVVVAAVMLLFFSGLMTGVRFTLELIGHSKAEAGARNLAVSRMEYIRSLNYDDIGTVSGIPSGNIPQTSSTTFNGVAYTERVLILYVDRPEDGLEELDENGVLEDSKRIKVEYSWNIRGEEKQYSLITDIAPKGMETTGGGGTLVIKVFDAAVLPVSGAEVRIYNDSEPTDVIDITTYSNSEGKVIIPGMPARGNYELVVTDTGYSTDGTYDLTAENPNPNPPHVAVASSSITTLTFFIDELSDIAFRTIGEPVTNEFTDEFDDATLLAETTGVAVGGGVLSLVNDVGGYVGSGTAYSTTTAPEAYTLWDEIVVGGSAPADTAYSVHLYSESGGTYTLVPDTDLPGNAVGWQSGTIDISTLATSTYSRLALGASLSTSNASSTPSVDSWSMSYVESEPPLPNITIDVSGTKTIGTDVLKYESEHTTDGSGQASVSLEWDTYTITVDGATEGYDIKEVRGVLPYVLPPGISETLTFILVPHTTPTLHVTVVNTSGEAISGATVNLQSTGYNETLTTSAYGQVFFTGMSSASSTLTVTGSGFEDAIEAVSVSGNTMRSVTLTPSI